MSLYTCYPAPTMAAAAEELRLKGIQGLKAAPSTTLTGLIDPSYQLNLAELNSMAILRVCPLKGKKHSFPGDHGTFQFAEYPDLPLPLPKLVFATKRALSKQDETRFSARKYTAGRSKFKYIYTLSVPTTIDRVKKITCDLEDDYVAPSGFCTPKSIRAFVAIRKIVSAAGAVLFDKGELGDTEPLIHASTVEGWEWNKATVKKSVGIEADIESSIPQVYTWARPQGIKPKEVPDRKDKNYLVFPYFRGMAGGDKHIIRKVLERSWRAFDPDVEKAISCITSFMSVADKALEGEQGRVLAHCAYVTNLCYEQNVFLFSIISGSEYVGCVVLGSKAMKGINHHGYVTDSVEYRDIVTEIAKISTSSEALERLAKVISDLAIDENEREQQEVDLEEVTPEQLSSSYMIWWYLSKRSEAFNQHGDTKRAVRECVAQLDFSQDVRREFTPSGFKAWLECYIHDDYMYSKEDGKDKYMNLEGIDYSFTNSALHGLFGGVAFSPIWPSGTRFVIPAPGADDPHTKEKEVRVRKGDKVEIEKSRDLEALTFVRCQIPQAIKDWEQAVASGSIWAPPKSLTRKEKMANLIWTGDSFATGWAVLKEFLYKEKKATKASESKKDEKEDKDVAGSAPSVDISKFSIF